MSRTVEEFDDALIKDKFPKLYGILFGPVQPFQEQLVLASLFVMSFECLKDFVEDNFQIFFSTGFEADDKGGYKPIMPDTFKETRKTYQEKYKDLCLSISNEKVGGASAFQTAMAWFYDMGAINDEDFKMVVHCNKTRNDLAHELYKWILDDSVPTLNKNLIHSSINLYFKISSWWIVNFEASVDPDAYEKYSQEDMKSAMSFNVQILLQLLNRF